MKKISSLVLCVGLFFGTISSASAADAPPQSMLDFGAIVTNENGELLNYEIKDVKKTSTQDSTVKSRGNSTDGGTVTEDYEVTVVIPTSEISPLDSTGAERTENSVTASISVTYDWRYKAGSGVSKKEIKITKFSGKWTPDQFIIVSDRKASITDGVGISGSTIRKTPTANTYNYDTNWGWVEWYPDTDVSGPRSNSEATLSAAGMGGTANIFVFVAVSKP